MNDKILETEKRINEIFTLKFSDEIEKYDYLLRLYEKFLTTLNGKIKDTDAPYYNIEILQGYNLSLVDSSYRNLSYGYLATSQIILRSVIENLVWSMYFFEFPEYERKYWRNIKGLSSSISSKINPRTNKNYSRWIEGALERVDVEGRKLTISDELDWYTLLFHNLCEEANKFVHTDISYIEPIITISSSSEIVTKIIGPREFNEDLIKNAIWKLIEVQLFILTVFEKYFSNYDVHTTEEERIKIRGIIKELNVWKKAYNKL